MVVDSLSELKIAFRTWRKQRKYSAEPVPVVLLKRAQRSIEVHGITAVVQATHFTRGQLFRIKRGAGKTSKAMDIVPSYSRLEVPAPSAAGRPLAEAETPSGMKLRIFQITPETLSLLTGLCVSGGAR